MVINKIHIERFLFNRLEFLDATASIASVASNSKKPFQLDAGYTNKQLPEYDSLLHQKLSN